MWNLDRVLVKEEGSNNRKQILNVCIEFMEGNKLDMRTSDAHFGFLVWEL